MAIHYDYLVIVVLHLLPLELWWRLEFFFILTSRVKKNNTDEKQSYKEAEILAHFSL